MHIGYENPFFLKEITPLLIFLVKNLNFHSRFYRSFFPILKVRSLGSFRCLLELIF
jgi:hypothetical protein